MTDVKPPHAKPHTCARKDCRAPDAFYWHRYNLAWYCKECAEAILNMCKRDGHGNFLARIEPEIVLTAPLADGTVGRLVRLALQTHDVIHELYIHDKLYATCDSLYDTIAVLMNGFAPVTKTK